MYKEKARTRKSVNPFTIKKGFYISELHFGYDGLESDSDLAGPFKTLDRARAVFKKIVNESNLRSDYNHSIKGPTHSPNGYETPWYHFEKTWREA
jgi:hypothetical protein